MPTVTTRVAQTFKKPNIAESYGTFATLQAAMTYAENADIKCAGLTVGIDQPDGSVKEYWLQPVEGQLQFVEKQEAGQAGTNAYVHIMYAQNQPTQDSDMHAAFTSDDKYIGIYTGPLSTAPTSYGSYTWAKFVGNDGASAVNPFKGLWSSFAALKAGVTATAGDYAYVVNSGTSTASIYIYDSTAGTDNYWADSGEDVDLGNVNINGGLSQTAKNLILSLFRKAAYTSNDAEADIEDLEDEFEDTRVLQRIEATFTQGANVIYDDASLDSLKQYLTVEAYYDNGTHETVDNADVLLSGTLTVGISTITASYEGKTDEFTVTVTAAPVVVSIVANYIGGDVVVNSNIDNLKADLTVTATLDNSSTRVLAANEYSLSGDLTTAGTAQITVTYLADNSITATFNVTVVAVPVFTVQDSEVAKKIAVSGVWNGPLQGYATNMTTRCSYYQFDKLFTGGKTYNFVVSSNYSILVGVQTFTQAALDKVSNHQNLLSASQGSPTADMWDSGWQTPVDGEFEVQIPEYSTGSDPLQLIKGTRFSFKMADDSNIPNDITIAVSVYEVSNI